MDTFHEKADRIFQVQSRIENQGDDRVSGRSPRPLAVALTADFPQVQRAVRISTGRSKLQYGDKVLQESLWYVSSDFLEVFSFQLKYGSRSTPAIKTRIILSEEAAQRYFGDRDPTGEQVIMEFGDALRGTFTVGGVLQKPPRNSSRDINILISYENLLDLGVDSFDDWSDFTRATFVEFANQPMRQWWVPGSIATSADNGKRISMFKSLRSIWKSSGTYRAMGIRLRVV